MTTRVAAVVLACAAATGTSETRAAGPAGACTTWAEPAERVGATPPALHELSGLVASHRHPGVFWAHNDSDNAFEMQAMLADGTVVATYRIADESAFDVEDIARGPCLDRSGQTCIFLGDIGDNLEVRRTVQLFELPEPEVLADARVPARRLPYRYTDGSHNAEVLLVDAAGGVWVVTKRLGDLGRLYRVEGLGVGRVGTARFVRRLRVPRGFGALSTAGDVHPSGTRVLLRTYTSAWEYRGTPADDVDAIFAQVPIEVPAPRQPQSEAIAYEAGGRSYLVGSEKTGAPLYRIRCADPPP